MKVAPQPLLKFDASDDESIYLTRIRGALPRLRRPSRLIDLFSGAGGLTLGFTNFFGHGFHSVWANDFNEYAANTYNKNFGPHCRVGDIVDLLESSHIPPADIVVGGPPCQGFSLLNKKRRGDPRKKLWMPFLEVVERSGAQVFVMENVPQLLGTREHEEIVSSAEALGFRVTWSKLLAANFGVPQTRERAFIVGCAFTDPSAYFPPKKTHYNPRRPRAMEDALLPVWREYVREPEPWRTVRSAIADLPSPRGTEIREETAPHDLHFGRTPTALSLQRYLAIPDEGMNRVDLLKRAPELTPACWVRKKSGGTDLFGRLWWDRPAFTIRTEFFKPEKGRYLHPEQHRPITHREAARFQSFPDDFKFLGTKIEIARQIGNAVPPMLAARIADSVYAMLASREVTG